MPRPPNDTLRERCVTEALSIIEADGLENLSLREVARRLGVSHQTPYRHFPSRDHLLAEVVRRAYDGFANHLDAAHTPDADPRATLYAMGHAYLSYALDRPLHYRLMFGTPLPPHDQHPEMLHSARHAFDLLREAIAQAYPSTPPDDLDRDALFVWSALHGLAAILRSDALPALGFSEQALEGHIAHIFNRIGQALEAKT
ncbi:MAG: TetR/AcrR family transcriptional regulator [Anaerolineae bacterium]|nr:TetR/AcrR family transcriptional regulator [Anaerolineae bacterium]